MLEARTQQFITAMMCSFTRGRDTVTILYVVTAFGLGQASQYEPTGVVVRLDTQNYTIDSLLPSYQNCVPFW